MNAVRTTRGFTLVEIMIVVVIVGIIAAFAIGPISDALRRGRVASVIAAVEIAHRGVTSYLARPGGPGYLPFTAGSSTLQFYSGTNGTSSNVGNAASLDIVFQGCGIFTGPIAIRMGKSSPVVTGEALVFSPLTYTFSPASGPAATPSADLRTIARIECNLLSSYPPDQAIGSNFNLVDTTIKPQSRIVSLIIPSVPIADARQLSLTMDGPDYSASDNVSEDADGRVAYPAPTGDITDVYVYVTHM